MEAYNKLSPVHFNITPVHTESNANPMSPTNSKISRENGDLTENNFKTDTQYDEEKNEKKEEEKKESETEKSSINIPFDEKKSLLKKRKLCGLIEGCDSIENYIHLNKIHEGVYGIVFRAKDKITDEIFAIKKEGKEGFPVTSIREINILLGLNHPNIVRIKEVVIGNSLDKIYVVMEYMEHELKDLLDHVKYNFSQAEIKCIMKQLLQGIEYLHSKSILHRDLKPSNLLYSNDGVLKICDFGLARKYASNIKAYTPVVVTLWYRAPEILLGCDRYTKAIDIWSIGCIFAELVLREPLFMGKNETEEIDLIFKILGTPTEENWPHWRENKYAKGAQFPKYVGMRLSELLPKNIISESGINLLKDMLQLDPSRRISATKALDHTWFRESPPPQELDLMPTFPPMNELPREVRKQREKLKNAREINQIN